MSGALEMVVELRTNYDKIDVLKFEKQLKVAKIKDKIEAQQDQIEHILCGDNTSRSASDTLAMASLHWKQLVAAETEKKQVSEEFRDAIKSCEVTIRRIMTDSKQLSLPFESGSRDFEFPEQTAETILGTSLAAMPVGGQVQFARVSEAPSSEPAPEPDAEQTTRPVRRRRVNGHETQ